MGPGLEGWSITQKDGGSRCSGVPPAHLHEFGLEVDSTHDEILSPPLPTPSLRKLPRVKIPERPEHSRGDILRPEWMSHRRQEEETDILNLPPTHLPRSGFWNPDQPHRRIPEEQTLLS
jgi:hypothetical protein